jgi:phosphate/sulfate permease
MNGTAAFVASVGTLAAVWFLFVVGANDAANAIGTTIGSNALHPTAAIVLAMLSQFVGACVAGHRGDMPIFSKAFESLPGDTEADIRCTSIFQWRGRIGGASNLA